jgi:hypothetical protein
MQGDLPDAFMWWAIGALTTTLLVGWRSVGIAAAALVLAWAIAALIDVSRPLAAFAFVWLAAVWCAYRIGSPTMGRVSAAAAAFWVVAVTHRHEAVVVGATALMACALFAVGSWHPVPGKMSRAWQNSSLAILLVTFVPLLIPDFHDDVPQWSATLPDVAAGVVLAVAALSPFARIRSTADVVVGLAAMVVIGWFGGIAAGLIGGPTTARLGTILFSILSLVVAVGLIRAALRLDSTASLILGVGFALAFLIIRWVSLIDSMLWSGAMLLLASAGFFIVARLWRGRRQLVPSPR